MYCIASVFKERVRDVFHLRETSTSSIAPFLDRRALAVLLHSLKYGHMLHFSYLERLACVSLISIREISRCWIASFVERWADVAFFHSGRDEHVFCSSTFERRARVELLHALRDEQMLHTSTPGETSMCFVHQHSSTSTCWIASCVERRADVAFFHSGETSMCCVPQHFETSMCWITSSVETWPRACVLFINIQRQALCWITSFVETWASVAFFHSEKTSVCSIFINIRETCMCWVASFVERWGGMSASSHSERDERVFYSSTLRASMCFIKFELRWEHEQVLHSFTPRETSVCSIHQHWRGTSMCCHLIRSDMSSTFFHSGGGRMSVRQHSRSMHVLSCFIRWGVADVHPLTPRETSVCFYSSTFKEASMCPVHSFVETCAASVAFFHSGGRRAVFYSWDVGAALCFRFFIAWRRRVLHSFTPRETSVCSIHQHTRESSRRNSLGDEHFVDRPSENEHALWCFTRWHMSTCCIALHLKRRACVLLIHIRETSMWCGTLLFGRWACVALLLFLKTSTLSIALRYRQKTWHIAPPWALDTCVLPLFLSFGRLCVFKCFQLRGRECCFTDPWLQHIASRFKRSEWDYRLLHP